MQKIRRMEKKREEDKKKMEELKKKTAEGASGLLQFGQGTSEVLIPRPRCSGDGVCKDFG